MKLYPNLVKGVVQSLDKIFRENYYANNVLESQFKEQKKWGARDRRFVADHTYGIVRNYRLLQELCTDKNNFYHLFAACLHVNGETIPSWNEFAGINTAVFDQRLKEIKNNPAVLYSFPDWLYELGKKELGAQWEQEMQSLNEQAKVVLRANMLKTNRNDLQELLLKEGIETKTVKDQPDALVLEERKNMLTSSLFKQGLFEIQDASSQWVVPFLCIEPGMKAIDACAGAGGKTLHLAALMQNKGQIIALDTEENKLNELQKRARRAGADHIETRVISSQKTIIGLEGIADRLLLDVPCTGLGVLKRNPSTKWKLSLKQVDEVKEKQKEILQNYSSMLKPGGLMVYATCSILPSENQEQVAWFIRNNKNFSFIRERIVLPSEGFDGFYMGLMKKER